MYRTFSIVNRSNFSREKSLVSEIKNKQCDLTKKYNFLNSTFFLMKNKRYESKVRKVIHC